MEGPEEDVDLGTEERSRSILIPALLHSDDLLSYDIRTHSLSSLSIDLQQVLPVKSPFSITIIIVN